MNCLCGRELVKKFSINKKEIFLCPLCAYEITVQTIMANYSQEYNKNIIKAAENRLRR